MTDKVAAGRSEPGAPGDVERALLLLRELAIELRPERAHTLDVGEDSELERDLGFDSLARTELMLRLERAFDVTLPEHVLAEAERAGDLLAALREAVPGRFAGSPVAAGLRVGPPAARPDRATTLTEMLDWHAEHQPERPHVILSSGRIDTRTLSYADLAAEARRVAGGLRQWGLEPGDRVAIMLPTGAEFLASFFGALYAGGVPVPIYPPFRPSQLEEHMRRQASTLANAGAATLITVPEARGVARLLRAAVPSLRAVHSADELMAAPPVAAAVLPAKPDDLAFLQYTSGSTGDPKGVMLTHANLLANIRAIGQGLQVRDDVVVVSWLPLYHDMGLIGAWLGSLYYGVPAVIMSPLSFLARPANWLWAIHRHRGTISAAPNFAYELCRTRIADDEIEGLDLGSLRMCANGAEAVSAHTVRGFIDRFSPYGFKHEAMAPVYGLAECSVGLAFPPPGRGPVIDRISRDRLARQGVAEPVPPGQDGVAVQEVVACGQALPGHEMRIVDAGGRELQDRREGRLQFRGPSATSGYYRNPERTAELFDGDWLESGDRAYMAGGDIYLTGRIKDIIIRAGRNVYPQEVEEVVGEVADVRRGCVVVFGAPDATSGTDRIVVVAETRLSDPAARQRLEAEVAGAATDVLGDPPDEIVLAPPRAVLKTSSGKIRRAACRQLYLDGALGRPSRALWWQVLRLGLHGLLPGLRQLLGDARALAYAGWWWTVTALTALLIWAAVMAVPGRRARWSLLRLGCRFMLWATATPVAREGLDKVPAGPLIIVSNHASYVDGIVLSAYLPGPIAFIAKGELREHPTAGPALRRLGMHMVERFDTEQSVSELTALQHGLDEGERQLFFAEGTLTRMPGLLGFRLGAFQLAAETGVPVLPVTLRGSRNLLRGDQWFPRRAHIHLDVAAPQQADGSDWAAAVRLRDNVRAEILARCGEPDLVHVSASDMLRDPR